MFEFQFLSAFLKARKAIKKAAQLKVDGPVFTLKQAEEIVRNATAYGWEVGVQWGYWGDKLNSIPSELNASPDNPFLLDTARVVLNK